MRKRVKIFMPDDLVEIRYEDGTGYGKIAGIAVADVPVLYKVLEFATGDIIHMTRHAMRKLSALEQLGLEALGNKTDKLSGKE